MSVGRRTSEAKRELDDVVGKCADRAEDSITGHGCPPGLRGRAKVGILRASGAWWLAIEGRPARRPSPFRAGRVTRNDGPGSDALRGSGSCRHRTAIEGTAPKALSEPSTLKTGRASCRERVCM